MADGIDRALVLAGGGVGGIAWLVGLIDALARHGVELGQADLMIGTSAGSAVATQVAGRSAASLIRLVTRK